MALSSHGAFVAAGVDRTVQMWHAGSGEHVAQFGRPVQISELDLQTIGHRFRERGGEDRMEWDVTGAVRQRLMNNDPAMAWKRWHSSSGATWIGRLAFSPRDEYLSAATWNTIYVFEVKEKRLLREIQGVRASCWTGKGDLLIASPTLRCVSIKTGETLWKQDVHADAIHVLPDGTRMLSLESGRIVMRRTENGDLSHVILDSERLWDVLCVEFSRDGRFMAVSRRVPWETFVDLWELSLVKLER